VGERDTIPAVHHPNDRSTQIEIVSPDYVMFAPEDRDLIVAFDRASRMFLVTTDQVASISLDAP
jgi:hypothetical protein